MKCVYFFLMSCSVGRDSWGLVVVHGGWENRFVWSRCMQGLHPAPGRKSLLVHCINFGSVQCARPSNVDCDGLTLINTAHCSLSNFTLKDIISKTISVKNNFHCADSRDLWCRLPGSSDNGWTVGSVIKVQKCVFFKLCEPAHYCKNWQS